jgi:hypothetical protein
MWQTDTQACEVIIAMLKPTRLDRLWTSDGRLAVDNLQTMVIGS